MKKASSTSKNGMKLSATRTNNGSMSNSAATTSTPGAVAAGGMNVYDMRSSAMAARERRKREKEEHQSSNRNNDRDEHISGNNNNNATINDIENDVKPGAFRNNDLNSSTCNAPPSVQAARETWKKRRDQRQQDNALRYQQEQERAVMIQQDQGRAEMAQQENDRESNERIQQKLERANKVRKKIKNHMLDPTISVKNNEIEIKNDFEKENYLVEAQLVIEDDDDTERGGGLKKGQEMAVIAEPITPRNGFQDFIKSRSGQISIAVLLFVIAGLTVGTVFGILAASKQQPTDVSKALSIFPSAAPTPFGFEQWLSLNTQEAIYNQSTPQYSAYQWLEEDMVQNNDGLYGSYDKEKMIKRFALATLYFSTQGEGWTESDNWLSHEHDESVWFSVSGSASDLNVDSFQILSLSRNGLRGSIPPEIGFLSSLKVLDLHGNRLSGTVPATIGRLSNLGRLELQINNLSGPLPTEIGHVTKLRNILFFHNSLSRFPTEVGKLTNLSEMRFEANKLDGNLPSEVGLLARLTGLRLDSNFFFGLIPSELGSLTNLETMTLKKNRLDGSIPIQLLSQTTSLTYLNLQENKLSGNISSDIGNLRNMKALMLHHNNFVNTIPSELGLLSNISTIDLSNNLLTGTLPLALGNLEELSSFKLLGNDGLELAIENGEYWPREICVRFGLGCSTPQPTSAPTCAPGERCPESYISLPFVISDASQMVEEQRPEIGSDVVKFSIFYQYFPFVFPSYEELDGIKMATTQFYSKVFIDHYEKNNETSVYDWDTVDLFISNTTTYKSSGSGSMEELEIQFQCVVKFEPYELNFVPDANEIAAIIEQATKEDIYMNEYVKDSKPFPSVFFDIWRTRFESIGTGKDLFFV